MSATCTACSQQVPTTFHPDGARLSPRLLRACPCCRCIYAILRLPARRFLEGSSPLCNLRKVALKHSTLQTRGQQQEQEVQREPWLVPEQTRSGGAGCVAPASPH